ncbi:hypothetical protein PBAL39_23317 [Pedobacter sp. BAL39]|nr:hypothetical protein PBAL39_23317 [Pedobacter sp. BAL39]
MEDPDDNAGEGIVLAEEAFAA